MTVFTSATLRLMKAYQTDTHTHTSPGQQEECEIGKVNPELIDRSGPRLSDFICLAFQTERRTNRDEAGMRNAKD